MQTGKYPGLSLGLLCIERLQRGMMCLSRPGEAEKQHLQPGFSRRLSVRTESVIGQPSVRSFSCTLLSEICFLCHFVKKNTRPMPAREIRAQTQPIQSPKSA